MFSVFSCHSDVVTPLIPSISFFFRACVYILSLAAKIFSLFARSFGFSPFQRNGLSRQQQQVYYNGGAFIGGGEKRLILYRSPGFCQEKKAGRFPLFPRSSQDSHPCWHTIQFFLTLYGGTHRNTFFLLFSHLQRTAPIQSTFLRPRPTCLFSFFSRAGSPFF